MDQSEVSRIAAADEMHVFIARLPAARQARVSIVCGAIVEQDDPTGTLNLLFRNEQFHALAIAIRNRGGR